MEKQGIRGDSFLLCVLLFGLIAHHAVTPVMSRSLGEFNDQKNYYSPGGGSSSSSTPKPPQNKPACPTPAGGGHPAAPSHGGGYGTPTPAHGSSSPTPGGGYYHSPPTSGASPAVKPPTTPTAPSTKPLFPPFFPGTCTYWAGHPDAIPSILGYWNNIGNYFGGACALIFGKSLSAPQALTNTRNDGYGALFREGTAALLNAMSCNQFPFTAQQVRDAFAGAMASGGAAGAQAAVFQQANEGKFK